jgi:hypothetical protein
VLSVLVVEDGFGGTCVQASQKSSVVGICLVIENSIELFGVVTMSLFKPQLTTPKAASKR